ARRVVPPPETRGRQRGVNTTLSTTVNMRIMRYEDNQTRTACALDRATGTERVPAPLPRPFPPFRGAAVPGTVPDRAVHRTPQQELRHHRPGRPRHQRAALAQPA